MAMNRNMMGVQTSDEDLYNQRAMSQALAPPRGRQAVSRNGGVARRTGGPLEPSAEPRVETSVPGGAVREGSIADAGDSAYTNKMPVPEGADTPESTASSPGESYASVARGAGRTPSSGLDGGIGDPAVLARIREQMGLGGPASAENNAIAGDALARGTAEPPSADQSTWNTDGFTPPAFAAPYAGGTLPGWEASKLADPNHQTPKYVWGRIALANPGDPKKQVAELLRAYPGAQFNGKDKVTGIPGLGPIDIFQGASSGQNTPQWIDEANAGGAQGSASGAKPGGGYGDLGPASNASNGLLDQMSQGSTHENLLAKIQQILGPAATDQQALLRALGGK
jgi:hypothetical protein